MNINSSTLEVEIKESGTREEKINGSEAVLKCLLEENIEIIFGYPGGAIMPIYDALYQYADKIKHYLTRHEQGAVHAAQGYARVSGKVGVCFATSGPGATNLITGIADAQIDSTPLVCITGQVSAHLLGTDAFQETDVIGISMPITKWNYQVTKASEIPYALARAFYIAKSGRPGPVVIDITKNAQFEMLSFTYKKVSKIRSYHHYPLINISKIEEAANIINEAKKTILFSRTRCTPLQCTRRTQSFFRKNRYPCCIYSLRIIRYLYESSAVCRIFRNAWKLCPQYKNK